MKKQGVLIATLSLMMWVVSGISNAATIGIESLSLGSLDVEITYNGTTTTFGSTAPFDILMNANQDPIVDMVSGDSTVTLFSTGALGDPAPSGIVDDMLGTINVDLSAIKANFALASTTFGGGGRGGGGSTSTTYTYLDNVAIWNGTTVVSTNTYDPLTDIFQLVWSTELSSTTVITLCMGCGGGTTPPDTVSGDLIGTANLSAVPVPAAVWLFGSGLIGLAGIARRRS